MDSPVPITRSSSGASVAPSLTSTDSDSSVKVREGFLRKRGGFWGGWKENWFTLQEGILSEFKYRATKGNVGDPINEYALEGCLVQNAEGITGLQNTFAIFKEGSKEQRFFQAKDASDAKHWINAIKRNISSYNSISLRQTVEAFNDAVILADDVGSIIDVNNKALELFGYTREEVMGKNVHILMPPKLAKRHGHYMHQFKTTGEKRLIGKPREMTSVRKDGTEFPILLSLGEIKDVDGVRIMATIRDLSEEEKVSSEKILEEMEANVDEISRMLKDQVTKTSKELVRNTANLKQKNHRFKETIQQLQRENAELNKQSRVMVAERSIAVTALLSLIKSDDGSIDMSAPVESAADVMKKLISAEIEATKSPTGLFREDSQNIRQIIAFFLLFGSDYLLNILEESIVKLFLKQSQGPLEATQTAPSTLSPEEREKKRTQKYSKLVVREITTSDAKFSSKLAELLVHLQAACGKRYGNEYKGNDAVTYFLFLRFFNPAIVNPARYGVCIKNASPDQKKILVNVGKVTMNLATNSQFSAGDSLHYMNDFIGQNRSSVSSFIDRILQKGKQQDGSK
eukprot:TRINITY_DN10411_c0_g1_i1.p1 TRINITY_DN10411_c0_g1~~TRINITY_DN10411_c0_g1_i1.p1  ORF type:complete len:571 (+),score=214.17 TRINITY_DN10411_c0_g1_i1:54-1766(+)